MLDKDQYNQEEYNDYYAQEVRGAEILGGREEGGNGKKIAFIVALLLLISALGYFGWKSMGSSPDPASSDANTKDTSQEAMQSVTNTKEDMSNIAESPKEESGDMPKGEKGSISQEEVIQKVREIASNKKMTQEEIATIVQNVMQKINQEKEKKVSRSDEGDTQGEHLTSQQQLRDTKLMESLSSLEADSLSAISDDVDKLPEVEKVKQASNSETPDTYNKVVLEGKKADSNDALSKLSSQMSSIVSQEEKAPKKEENSYAKSIKKEVKVRKKEMRYVIVRKGDTLGKIAKRVYGKASDYRKIFKANPDILRRPDRIYIGQKLRVPE